MKKPLLLIILLLILIATPARAATVTSFLAAPPNVSAWATGNCETTLTSGYTLPATALQSCVSANISKTTIITTTGIPPLGALYTKVRVIASIGSGNVIVFDQNNTQYTLINETGLDADDPIPNSITISGTFPPGILVIQAYCVGCEVNGQITEVDISYPSATPTRTATVTRTPTIAPTFTP